MRGWSPCAAVAVLFVHTACSSWPTHHEGLSDEQLGAGQQPAEYSFRVGDVVQNTRPGAEGTSGVIARRDSTFRGTEQWWQAMMPKAMKRTQPFYQILVSEANPNKRMPGSFVRYDAQSALRLLARGDDDWHPVKHDWIAKFYSHYDDSGRYLPITSVETHGVDVNTQCPAHEEGQVDWDASWEGFGGGGSLFDETITEYHHIAQSEGCGAATTSDSLAKEPTFLHQGEDCFMSIEKCGRQQGPCLWCGDGLCCKKGSVGNGCDGFMGGSVRYECAAPRTGVRPQPPSMRQNATAQAEALDLVSRGRVAEALQMLRRATGASAKVS